MKKILSFSFFLASLNVIFAQENGKYSFFASEAGKNINFTVKGEYQGKKDGYDFYYEKVDALNHKIKQVKLLNGKFNGMFNYMIDETLVSVSNLKVKEEKYDDKTFYLVNLRPLNDKKPLKSKYYNASKGAFDEKEGDQYNINATFATKAKAEAFIKDILAAGLR